MIIPFLFVLMLHYNRKLVSYIQSFLDIFLISIADTSFSVLAGQLVSIS